MASFFSPPVAAAVSAGAAALAVPPRLSAGVGGPGPGLASIERQIAQKPADEALQVGRALALLANRRDAETFALCPRLETAHPDDLATLWAAKGFVALRQG